MTNATDAVELLDGKIPCTRCGTPTALKMMVTKDAPFAATYYCGDCLAFNDRVTAAIKAAVTEASGATVRRTW